VSLQDVFSDIYRKRKWGSGYSASGDGSDPDVARPYVNYVNDVLRQYGVKSVLDIGHGDWRMWPEEAFLGTDYIGIDVAIGVSESARQEFANSRRQFLSLNAVEDELPPGQLVLLKDVLQHLSDRDVARLLGRVRSRPLVLICHDISWEPTSLVARWNRVRWQLAPRARLSLLMSGKPPFRRLGRPQNSDIPSGEYRCLDLEQPPWSLADFDLELLRKHDIGTAKGASAFSKKRIWLLRGSSNEDELPAAVEDCPR